MGTRLSFQGKALLNVFAERRIYEVKGSIPGSKRSTLIAKVILYGPAIKHMNSTGNEVIRWAFSCLRYR